MTGAIRWTLRCTQTPGPTASCPAGAPPPSTRGPAACTGAGRSRSPCGAGRRLRLVPFEVITPLAEQDPHLPSKLAAEADGILRWLIDGYAEWRSRGLADPATVITATSGYRAEEDALGRDGGSARTRARHRSPVAERSRFRPRIGRSRTFKRP
jgi:hypothetical protein